jgi:hypothetical protein
LLELNPWGYTSILTTIIACIFAFFLWKNTSSNAVTRRFIFLLFVEIFTVLTSVGGISLLFSNYTIPTNVQIILGVLHILCDTLMLILYPVFVAYALPIKILKPLTTLKGRIGLFLFGAVNFLLTILIAIGIIPLPITPTLILNSVMVCMFVLIVIFSVLSIKTSNTKLAKEKSLAFAWAFGMRDIAWATVYLTAATGWLEIAPMFFTQLYVLATLIYIPIMAYGILKVQMLDIEIKLQWTIKNSTLAGIFVALFYIISEGSSTYLSNLMGDIIGLAVSALVIFFLAPLHRMAEKFSSSVVGTDVQSNEYTTFRRLQMYSAAIEEALAYGDITKGQIALLDRLKESLNLSEVDAHKLELDLHFNRALV